MPFFKIPETAKPAFPFCGTSRKVNRGVYFKGSNAKALAGVKEVFERLRESVKISGSDSNTARTRTPGATSCGISIRNFPPSKRKVEYHLLFFSDLNGSEKRPTTTIKMAYGEIFEKSIIFLSPVLVYFNYLNRKQIFA